MGVTGGERPRQKTEKDKLEERLKKLYPEFKKEEDNTDDLKTGDRLWI